MALVDPFLHNKKIDYAIKLIQLNPADYVPQTFEFVGSLLKIKELKTLNDFLTKVIDDETRPYRFVNSNSSRYSTIPSKTKRDEYIAELAVNLQRSSEDWADILMDISRNQPKAYRMIQERLLKSLALSKMPGEKSSHIYKNVDELGRIFNLDMAEKEIMVFLYLFEVDGMVSEIFGRTDYNMDKFFQSVKLYCHFFNLNPNRLKEILGKKGKLSKTLLLDPHSRNGYVEASPSLCWYLTTNAKEGVFGDYFEQYKKKTSTSLSDHVLPPQNLKTLQSLLGSDEGTNILLYGSPGTGKTEFVKSLSKTVNQPIYFIKQHDDSGSGNLSTRKTAIVAAQNLLPPNSIVVIDEAEQILRSPSESSLSFLFRDSDDSKAWINDFLETNKLKLIWIVNNPSEIDQSTRRRFSFSQEFQKFNQTQRLKIWKVAASNAKVRFLNDEDILSLSQKYEINAGGIALALGDVKKMRGLKTKRSKIDALENLLEQHLKFVFDKKTSLAQITPSYDKDLININLRPDDLTQYLSRFYEVIEHHGMSVEFSNISILFHGAPGTGKTEFAKYLAQKVGKELLVKRLSDIRSMWYGQTLKNIAKMFSEASEDQKILFLDEADSMFVERGQGGSAHVEAETNELLTQMENFKGVLICSTNFESSMDQAVMRRFSHKVKFDYLKPDQVVNLFTKMFGTKLSSDLSQDELIKLKSLNFLTPGDFKVVQQKTYFDTKLEALKLIKDLQAECAYKKVSRSKISL